MAKSANSKVIFLPATNQTVTESMSNMVKASGEGPSSAEQEYGAGNPSFQSAINSNIIEHM